MKTIFAAAPVLLLVALAAPAQAAPRDQVLDSVSRCGAIADDRGWLDCLYGAAQPMRAQLSLPPAPASQQALVPLSGTAPPMINSPARYDTLYGISRCGGIGDDRVWLDCVYGAAQPMRAKLGLAPAPAAQQKLVPPAMPGMGMPVMAAPATTQAMNAPPPAPPAAPAPGGPGFFERMITPHVDARETPTTLRSYKFDANGTFVVTLANGETWRQDQGDIARARWSKAPQSYSVQIVPTSSSYYYLKAGGQVYMVNKG